MITYDHHRTADPARAANRACGTSGSGLRADLKPRCEKRWCAAICASTSSSAHCDIASFPLLPTESLVTTSSRKAHSLSSASLILAFLSAFLLNASSSSFSYPSPTRSSRTIGASLNYFQKRNSLLRTSADIAPDKIGSTCHLLVLRPFLYGELKKPSVLEVEVHNLSIPPVSK